MIQGKVVNKTLNWKSTPHGKSGEAVVEIDGKEHGVKWVRDEQGIWIETANGYVGYDSRKTVSDDGQIQFTLLQRRKTKVIVGINFLKAGEENSSSANKVKKGAKIKSQMPGKILRINVKVGDAVTKGQSIMVMEAMKMENEIKSPQDAVVKEIKVTQGQAVETGVELLVFS